jgi:hypothetical protein
MAGLRPSEGEEIGVKTYRAEGVAWAGERKIARVEVRVDGGAWEPGNLSASPVAMIWTPWSYEWQVPSSGRYTLEVGLVGKCLGQYLDNQTAGRMPSDIKMQDASTVLFAKCCVT